MQRAMDRLSGFVERRRLLVVGVWLVVLLAAIPFSLRQTEHLTSGGFTVPGSGSDRTDRALPRFDGVQRDQLAAVLAIDGKASDADVRAAVDRVRSGVGRVDHVGLAPGADDSPSIARSGDTRVAIVPLR